MDILPDYYIMNSIKPFFLEIALFLRAFVKTTNFWSLVFVILVLAANSFLPNQYGNEYISQNEFHQSFGGPISFNAINSGAVVGSLVTPTRKSEFNSPPLIASDSSTIIGYASPITNLIPTRNGLKKYKVKTGDTLSAIAAQFGIDIETIRLANSGIRSAISPGDNLIILPVPGVTYEIRPGDSLELVAARYEVSEESVKKYNPDYQKIFSSPGEIIILPYVKKKIASIAGKNLPDLKTYFVIPARGWNWGELHEYNAVDIADSCGKPIYASAEGVVIEEAGNGFWNSGYGNYILLEHPNGTKTRYAHTAKNLVRIGDYVSQSAEISLIGNTGNSHGPSGCHLHFEVYGAKNPFAIK